MKDTVVVFWSLFQQLLLKKLSYRNRKDFKQPALLCDLVTLRRGGGISHGWPGSQRVQRRFGHIEDQDRNLLHIFCATRRVPRQRHASSFDRRETLANDVDFGNRSTAVHQCTLGCVE